MKKSSYETAVELTKILLEHDPNSLNDKYHKASADNIYEFISSLGDKLDSIDTTGG